MEAAERVGSLTEPDGLDQARPVAASYRKTYPWAGEKNLRADMVRAMFAKDLYR